MSTQQNELKNVFIIEGKLGQFKPLFHLKTREQYRAVALDLIAKIKLSVQLFISSTIWSLNLKYRLIKKLILINVNWAGNRRKDF